MPIAPTQAIYKQHALNQVGPIIAYQLFSIDLMANKRIKVNSNSFRDRPEI